MPTLKDIAERAGVSITSVSLALKDHPSISLKTKQCIWEIKEALGYRAPMRMPESLARRRREALPPKVRDIAYLLISEPEDADGTGSEFHQLAKHAADRQWRPIYATCIAEELEQGHLPAPIRTGELDGLIVSGACSDAGYQSLEKLRIPILTLGIPPAGMVARASCEPDFDHGAQLITQRLRELDHVSIAVALESSSSTANAFHPLAVAIERAASRQGLEYLGCGAVPHRREGESLLKLLIKRRPTALVIGSAKIAREVYDICESAGLRVPADLSVVSFDTATGSLVSPSLACTVPQEGVMRRAIQKLGNLMNDPKGAISRELFPREFLPGGSIGHSRASVES